MDPPAPRSEPQNPALPDLQSSKIPKIAILSSKGLGTCMAGIVIITALLRADPKDIPKIVETLVKSNTIGVVGWVLAVVFLAVAIIVIKLLTSLHTKEIDRISAERDKLQRVLIEKSKNE